MSPTVMHKHTSQRDENVQRTHDVDVRVSLKYTNIVSFAYTLECSDEPSKTSSDDEDVNSSRLV
jgi:hypothetical protein